MICILGFKLKIKKTLFQLIESEIKLVFEVFYLNLSSNRPDVEW